MVDVIREDEGSFSGSRAAHPELSSEGASFFVEARQRVEDWTAVRWGERPCTWIVNGPGIWEPRLRPVSGVTFERWDGSDWVSADVSKAPVGYELDAFTYKAEATVGSSDNPPEAVQLAVARLANYWADMKAQAAVGASSVSDGDFSVTRSANATARAMHYSGAADLLRGFRR